jgi:hypothetical protein
MFAGLSLRGSSRRYVAGNFSAGAGAHRDDRRFVGRLSFRSLVIEHSYYALERLKITPVLDFQQVSVRTLIADRIGRVLGSLSL